MAKKKATKKKAAKAKTTKKKAVAKKATKKAAKKVVKKTATRKAAKPAKRAKTTATRTTAAKVTATARRELQIRTSGFEKVAKTRTKSQILSELSESTGLSKREVGNVFDNLQALMNHDLTKGPGMFQVPGLLKLVVIKKKAVPARKGINPFTGEEAMFKAKPARNVVKARPLKGLKDMVAKKR